jgi:orotate phosphoribosyltransferase
MNWRMAMTEQEVLEIFEQNGAFLKGHFKLSSGLHSERYLQCALVLQNPILAEKFCKELAKHFVNDKIDIAVGPALGGIIVAYEMARALGINGNFTERVDDVMTFRRGFDIKPGQRVLICEDVITTGNSTKNVMTAVTKKQGVVAGVVSIIDRTEKPIFGVKYKALTKVKIDTYQPEDCPLCKKGMEITKPGSRNK